MRKFTGSSFGTSGRTAAATATTPGNPDGERLAECPCGNDGVWYRVQPVGEMKRGPSIGNVTGDDIDTNLCDACFVAMIAEDKRDAWKRIEAGEKWADQRSRYEGFDDSQASADDSW